MIGLVPPLLLATPTTKFSLDRKRRSPKRNQNAISLDRKVLRTLQITTPTPSLVEASLKGVYLICCLVCSGRRPNENTESKTNSQVGL